MYDGPDVMSMVLLCPNGCPPMLAKEGLWQGALVVENLCPTAGPTLLVENLCPTAMGPPMFACACE